MISGGSGSISIGINNSNTSSTLVRNNTIDGGTGSSESYGIVNGLLGSLDLLASPTIENNIIFTSGSSTEYCIYDNKLKPDPVSVRNNDLFGCSTALYHDGDGDGDFTTISSMETELISESITTGGNASADPTFVDINGGDGLVNTLADNDWKLMGSSPVKGSGLNGAHSAEIWGFTTDKDGTSRSPLNDSSTTGWSIGAYEKD